MTQHQTPEDMNPQIQCSLWLKFESQSQAMKSNRALKYSEFGKLLCTYKRCWKWCPQAYIEAWTHLILFANTFCRSACEMFLMDAVIAVNSLRMHGWSRYTAAWCTVTFWTPCTCTSLSLINVTINVSQDLPEMSRKIWKRQSKHRQGLSHSPFLVSLQEGHNPVLWCKTTL